MKARSGRKWSGRNDVETEQGVTYHVLGHGSEAILCLPSLGLGRFLFHRMIPYWSQSRQVVLWDPRGVGDNAAFAPSMEAWVADAVEILQAVGMPAHAVGVSVGSFVAARLALSDRSGLLRTVALVSTTLGFLDGDATVEARRSEIEQGGFEAYARAYVDATVSPGAHAELKANLVAELAAVDPEAYLAAMRITYTQDNGPIFHAVTHPTLVIVGTDDRRTPPEAAELAARVLPNSWLAVVPRAGHLVPLDQPKRLNEILEEFWQG